MKEHIIINKDRTVVVPDSVRKIGIQYDHKVNTLTFDCPRYADDNQSIDLSRMAIYINFSRNDKTKGSIAATNVFVDPDDPEIMHFDFIITRSVTLVNGPIICLVCAKSTDAEGVEVNHWNSELFNKLSVGEGMEAEEELTEEEIDYITSLLQEINTTHAEVADIDTRVEDLEFNQEKQGVVSEVDLGVMTWTEGSYITGSGTIGSSSGYGISELVTLPKMSTLILDATGYQSDVAMIAKSDHTPLVTSVDGKTHYEYYTDEEIQVYISCKTTVAKSAKIVRNVGETLSDLERENSELKGDLGDLGNLLEYYKCVNLFNPSDIKTGGYYNGDTWIENRDYFSTGLISCSSGEKIYRRYPSGFSSMVETTTTFYDENGNCVTYSYGNENYLTVPSNSNIKFFKTPLSNSALVPNGNFKYAVISKEPITSFSEYLPEPILKRIDRIENSIKNWWNNKIWYAYGTSLTSIAQGKYANYVASFSGLELHNKGIPGGALVMNRNIYDALMDNTDGKADADLITIEVGANDFSAPLGDISSMDNNTFCGALNTCLKNVLMNCPKAQVVLMPSTRQRTSDDGSTLSPLDNANSYGVTYEQRYEAIRKVAEANGVYFIPFGSGLGLGLFRMQSSSKYNVDHIHHTELSGYNLAQGIWSYLKNIPLWYDSLPS